MKIHFRENGPIVLPAKKGDRVVFNGQERVLEKDGLALCRCGASADKPFCDKSHKRIGFQAPRGDLEGV